MRPDNRDSRIGPGSAAIDAGVDAGVDRDIDRESFLFTTRQSPRMTTGRARQIVNALAQRVGIQRPISSHSLWHTLAIETLRVGASPVVVQKVLGHSNLFTTQRYVDHLE